MNRAECARVLTKIQLGDNRVVDALVLEEWFDTIGHLGFEDAIAGVKLHRQESDQYLLPVHVIRGAARARERRAVTQQQNVFCRVEGHAYYPMPCDRCEEEVNDV